MHPLTRGVDYDGGWAAYAGDPSAPCPEVRRRVATSAVERSSRGRRGRGELDLRGGSAPLDDDDTIATVRRAHGEACEASRRATSSLGLDDMVYGNRRGPLPLRWVYLHVLRELAQQCGHPDILREQFLASSARASAHAADRAFTSHPALQPGHEDRGAGWEQAAALNGGQLHATVPSSIQRYPRPPADLRIRKSKSVQHPASHRRGHRVGTRLAG
ncbi:DinB family protein [Micromonospora purpureochromogenes]|uniref:DinB family protein n=1 Tax=Micromonospora purpureochromogenes TaxID=47872 RepID=UPI00211C2A42|nr:DinB family protein [Micromonospora purpureochromogenes]